MLKLLDKYITYIVLALIANIFVWILIADNVSAPYAGGCAFAWFISTGFLVALLTMRIREVFEMRNKEG